MGMCALLLGQQVFAQNYGQGPSWVARAIVGVCGGVIMKEEQTAACGGEDQIQLCGDSPVIEDLFEPCPNESTPVVTDCIPREIWIPEEDGIRSDARNCTPDWNITKTPIPFLLNSNQNKSPPVRRYPWRSRQPPEGYGWTPNSCLEECSIIDVHTAFPVWWLYTLVIVAIWYGQSDSACMRKKWVLGLCLAFSCVIFCIHINLTQRIHCRLDCWLILRKQNPNPHKAILRGHI